MAWWTSPNCRPPILFGIRVFCHLYSQSNLSNFGIYCIFQVSFFFNFLQILILFLKFRLLLRYYHATQKKKNQTFDYLFHVTTFPGAGSWKNEKEKRFWKIMNKHNKKWEYLWARSFKSGNHLLIAYFLLALFIFWQKYFFFFTYFLIQFYN